MMDWLYTNKRKWRSWFLLLMGISIVGPWVYEAIYVPSTNPCSHGFRIDDDFCGEPLSGIRILFMLLASISSISFRFFTGDAGEGEFLMAVGVILYILLPLTSLILVISKKDPSPRKEKLHIGILVFTSMLGVLGILIVTNDVPHILRMWGLWGYSLMVFVGSALELLSLFANRSQNMNEQSMIM